MPSSIERTCMTLDRKSTRLNSSHVRISYAVFCLKKKTIVNSAHRLRHLQHVVSSGISGADGFCQRQEASLVRRGRVFFFNDAATTEIYTLSLHDALPI